MSIVLRQIGNASGKVVAARLRHCENEFDAHVHGDKDALTELLDQDCLVEMSFERVIAWREISNFTDDQSGIKQDDVIPEAVTIRGRVHGIMELEPGAAVIDLYLQAGPEFLAIESQELGGSIPSVGSALEVTVYGLCFYPTGT